MGQDLENIILSLINLKREGEYWDFKEKFYSNKANLVHDIICMANNRADRDTYIIFGVRDEDFEIVRIENDLNRKTQQQFIDVLKSKKFIGGIRPIIELRNLFIKNHEVDVLIIKNTNETPYYLVENYKEQNRTVRAQYICTRVGDTNTNINKGADINQVEYLWRKRFLLDKPPLEQIKNKLRNKDEWVREDNTFYNRFNPEYRVELEDDDYDKERLEFYSFAMMNQSTRYGTIVIKCYETKLYSDQFVILDSGRYVTTVPNWEFIRFGNYKPDYDYCFKYFLKDSINYVLHEFLAEENEEALYASRRFSNVVLTFENKDEKDKYMNYILCNKSVFEELMQSELKKNTYEWIECTNQTAKKENIKRLITGKVLIEMYKSFRKIEM
ncbi:MAG: ATP-binding protein [Clostridium sp.]|uniref:ATP-binding protein n=1 Tax=Clostridium sp. TaxID=1506 RepID=UPI002A911835|nr:ATP-binding protein [Clostridium sp.]MDY6228038.1 ATP-binding protein [Clostridium sp.]